MADNKTGYFGVTDSTNFGVTNITFGQPKSFVAQVTSGGKLVRLGKFATAEEAALCVARSPEGKAAAARAAAAERAAAAMTPAQRQQVVKRKAAEASRALARRKRVTEAKLLSQMPGVAPWRD